MDTIERPVELVRSRQLGSFGSRVRYPAVANPCVLGKAFYTKSVPLVGWGAVSGCYNLILSVDNRIIEPETAACQSDAT